MANPMNGLKSRTPARLYVYDAVLNRLTQDLEHMTTKLRPFIQEEDAVVGQRHVARQRHLAPTDQPDIRDGVMGGAKRAGREHPVAAPMRRATGLMRMVSTASARVITGFASNRTV